MRARMFCVLVTFVLLTGFSIGAVSDPVARQFVAGELIVSLNPNGGADQLQQLAQQMDLTVDYLGVPGVYHLIMKGAKEGTVSEMQTLETVQKLKDTGLFAYVGPNKLYYPLQREVRPNDPRYGEQWGLEMINMPRAWVFQKGKANVIVAVVDTGVDMNHPDLKGRLLPGRDTADQDNDPNPPGNDLDAGHGTHVAGIVGATTNNGIGIAGVTWEGVQILPVKASPNSGIGAFPQDALIRAVQFCIDQKANVVNMSLGGPSVSDTPDMADPLSQLIISATQQGMVFVMAAGNSYLEGNPPFYPANLASVSDMVLAVAAVGPRREHAVYSEARPYTTVAAPGGNAMATGIETDDILSTLPGGNYAYAMGTSMAAPHAAGAVAILLSQQDVKPAKVKKLLQDTAAADGRSVPNPEFGYGIIDVYNAIRRVATSAAVVSPAAAEVVETLKPTLVFSVTNTTPALVTIAIDGQAVTSTEIADNYVPAPDGIVATIKIARRLAPGTHTVKITAKNAIDSTIASSDEITFQVSPYVLRAGRSLISIPYFQPQTGQLTRSVPAETMLGTGFQMFRWMPQGRYAKYSSWGAPKDPAASFDQTTEQVGPEGGNTMAPLGLAYFVDLPTDTPVLTEGTPAPEVPYRIPLKAGWNMVGNPFAFNVPWVACEVETIAGVRLSLQEAVDKNIILPQLYRYEGGVYTWQTAPAGELYKWEGFWVRAFEDCTLIVMPLPAGGRSVPADATLSGGGWLLRLSAVAGNARDGNTIIGVNSRAADGYGREDVPKPPSISPYVSVKVVNPDWGLHAGAYAQDVRRSDRRQTWQLQVETDQVNEPVTLRWERLTDVPSRVRLTLVDNVTGKRVAMRTTGSYAYQPGGVGTRSFTVIAETDMGSALRISSVRVRATRGSGFAIDYALSAEAQVQITITDASGKPVASLVQSTRSAGLNSATWNGRDSKGVVVPAGSYLVRIEATSTDGEHARMITPVVITR
ncbi:MAG: S8 family serine peptidase [Armatimonadota bacterium]